jgi:hypothetical protein
LQLTGAMSRVAIAVEPFEVQLQRRSGPPSDGRLQLNAAFCGNGDHRSI